jgi:D-lactate dehydrogenase
MIADDVYVPDDWGCCGFAGDRGLYHPELTAAATRRQAESVKDPGCSRHASSNRPCEIALTRATGNVYCHILELLDEATRPPR